MDKNIVNTNEFYIHGMFYGKRFWESFIKAAGIESFSSDVFYNINGVIDDLARTAGLRAGLEYRKMTL